MKIGGISNFCGNWEEIYKFCGNRGEYAICIIDSEGWTPLPKDMLYQTDNQSDHETH